MKIENSKPPKPSHYELLLRAYDKAQTAFERAKSNEKSAKHSIKTADKDIKKTDKAILELEFKRAKYRRKARKVAFEITKLRLKQWLKLHEEDVKLYQLSEEAQVVDSQQDTEEKKPRKRRNKSEMDAAVPSAAESLDSAPKSKKLVKSNTAPKNNTPPKVKKPKPPVALPTDLTLIEGIGPKVFQYLQDAGISTFDQLAAADFDTLKGILSANSFKFANPTTWAEQAQLVVDGKMDALEVLREKLKSSKKR